MRKVLGKLKHNELVSKKHKNTLSYMEHLLILPSTFTGCVSISAFASAVGIPVGITSSLVGFRICVLTAGIKKYQSIIKIKEKSMIKW